MLSVQERRGRSHWSASMKDLSSVVMHLIAVSSLLVVGVGATDFSFEHDLDDDDALPQLIGTSNTTCSYRVG